MDESDQVLIEHQQAMQAQRAMTLKIALDALSNRALTVLGLVLNAFCTVWCMINPEYLRVVTALLFAVTTWTLINVRPAHKGE